MTTDDPTRSLDFIREIVTEDCRTGKWEGRAPTRFPPEPGASWHIRDARRPGACGAGRGVRC
jgi:glutaminyl-tRNA synthetase